MDPHEPTGEPLGLSADLARYNPDRFKTSLVGNLGRYTKLADKAWELALQRGLVSLQDLILDPTSWRSRSGEGKEITLGTAELSLPERRRLIFEDESFPYPRQVASRLSHEITHKLNAVVHYQNTDFANLYDTAFNVRSRPSNRGFSSLGSEPYYTKQGPAIQAKEDMVELANMYLIDPSYLQSFLHFLSNPRFREERRKRQLAAISVGSAKHMFIIIDKAVGQELESSK